VVPRRVPGRSADGRRWDLLVDRGGVTAVTTAGTVAAARVSPSDGRAAVAVWTAGTDLPQGLRAQLVAQALAHPVVRARPSVLVTLPRGDVEALDEARRRLVPSHTHVAGSTCLVEGRLPGAR
jgi:hypothetical protein